jgi:hypothetical protein
MTSTSLDERLCPFCRQSVKSAAVKCFHCQSAILPPATLEHGGVCPSCAEAIPTDALVCFRCKSAVHPNSDAVAGAYGGQHVFRVPRQNLPPIAGEARKFYPACPPYMQDPLSGGTAYMCLIDEDAQYCIYEVCGSGPAPS